MAVYDRDGRIIGGGQQTAEDHPLIHTIAEVPRLPESERLELKGLSQPEVAGLIAQSAERPPDAHFTAAVYAETEGNPFFLVKTLRLPIADGALEGGTPAAGFTVPPSVRAAIGLRLERLSPAGRRCSRT